MSWYRRSSAPGLKSGNRRRSSANYAVAAGRRCSLSTFAASSRVRSSSKGHLGREVPDDDIELCQPPLEELPRIPGYEEVTFESYTVPPPTIPLIIETEPPSEDVNGKYAADMTVLSENDVRRILLRYADTKCVFDKDAAREMKITSLEYQPGYKYTLESFTETRQVAWSFEPYTGAQLDEPSPSDPAPDPWMVQCTPPQSFQTHSVILDVPHTDVLLMCHACGGVGSKRCNACSAAGWESCSYCLGDGHKTSLQGQRERCFRCLGTGRKKCWKCAGDTIAVCRGCSGTGQIRCFIAITISWSNHVDNHIVEPQDAAVLGEKLEYANGYIVFEDEKPMVSPVMLPDTELASISSSFLEKHSSLTTNEKLILQRHSVCAIPVYCISYKWEQVTRHFFVYGKKNEVYAPDFPERICCCIVL